METNGAPQARGERRRREAMAGGPGGLDPPENFEKRKQNGAFSCILTLKLIHYPIELYMSFNVYVSSIL